MDEWRKEAGVPLGEEKQGGDEASKGDNCQVFEYGTGNSAIPDLVERAPACYGGIKLVW